jgi:hypothetical protein
MLVSMSSAAAGLIMILIEALPAVCGIGKRRCLALRDQQCVEEDIEICRPRRPLQCVLYRLSDNPSSIGARIQSPFSGGVDEASLNFGINIQFDHEGTPDIHDTKAANVEIGHRLATRF